MKTKLIWNREHVFDNHFEGTIIRIDGEKKEGPGPKSLLLSGLAGCTGIDIVDILTKMRVDFSGLQIEAEADQTDEHPKVFKEITLTYTLKTDPANEEKVLKAIRLSLDKYCGVAAMLRKNSPIEFNLNIIA